MAIETQPNTKEKKATAPGWYKVDGTLRYHDGEKWTNHIAPPYPDRQSISISEVALAVMLGVLGSLFVLLVGAQLAPDEIYLPVKFVVEEAQELPDF